MPLFGDDPKDQIIATLQDQVAYLRALIKDLRDENLALKDPSAYRITHPREGGDGEATLPTPTLDRSDYRPEKSLQEVKESFGES